MSKKNTKKPSLNKNDIQALKDIAARLPHIPIKTQDGKGVPQHRKFYGSQLIEQGMTEVEGKKIRPGKLYYQPETDAGVNHFNELEKAFFKDGMIGVNMYVEKVNKSI